MKDMTNGSIVKHLVFYAIPLILGNLFQLTYNAVDSIIIGRFAGEGSLAAVGASNPIMTIVILGVSGICIGASVIMSEFYGANKIEELKKEVATTIKFGIIFSSIVFIVGIIFSPHILTLMNVPDEILKESTIYLRIIFLGFPFTFLYNAISYSLRSIGDSKTAVKYLAMSSVVNGCLDFIFIYYFNLGVIGAGLATVIAEAVSVVLCVNYVYRNIPILKFSKNEFKVDKSLLKLTLKNGSITALQQACQPIGKVLIQSTINTLGVSAIAAFNAVNRVDDFACVPEQSISNGMMTFVAQNRGADKKERIIRGLKIGIILEFIYWIFICIATLLLKKPIMMLFVSEGKSIIIEIGTRYLTIMAFFYMLPGFTNGMQGFFRGMGSMTVTLIGTITQISIRTIVVFILVPIMGLEGAAYACLIGWTAMLIFEVPYYFYCKHTKWKEIIE